uniref:VWFA domain-containing protein n=1 Tax=Panagrellus redivivus TaxID=6233 RepID=A0A7E5A223_PANRE
MSNTIIDTLFQPLLAILSWIAWLLELLMPMTALPEHSIAIFMSNPETSTGMISVRNGSKVRLKSVKKYPGSVKDAAKAFAVDVPPKTVHAVFILIEPETLPSVVKCMAPALEAAGYRNIVTLGDEAFRHVSMPIDAAQLQCDVGDFVAVLFNPDNLRYGAIVERVEAGYKKVKISKNLPYEIIEYPTLKHIILRGPTGDISEAHKSECRSLYPGMQYHFPRLSKNQLICNHAWRSVDGATFIEETVSMEVFFKFGLQEVPLPFRGTTLPTTKTFQLDIMEWKHVFVCVKYTNQHEPLSTEFEVFQCIDLKTRKDRVLRVTVSINMHHVPSINVQAISPVKVLVPKFQKVGIEIYKASSFQYYIFGQSGTTELNFSTIDLLMADLMARFAPEDVGVILYLGMEMDSSTIGWWRTLEEHGYSKQYFGGTDIVPAMFLFGYNVAVAEGECVGMWVSEQLCTILKRVGTTFRYLGFYQPSDDLDLLDRYDVKTVVFCQSFDEICTIDEFGDRNVIVGNADAIRDRYKLFYLSELISKGNFGKYTVSQFNRFLIFVYWGDRRLKFDVGNTVQLPFGWTTEIDLDKAYEVKIVVDYIHGDFKQEKVFYVGSSSVKLDICIEDMFTTTVNCVPLPKGHAPRSVSFCLLIERTTSGFRRTLYFRDSGKTVVENFANLYIALKTFTLVEHAVIVFIVSDSTSSEHAEWRQFASEYRFQGIQFVNGAILTLNSALIDVDFTTFVDNVIVLVTDMTAIDTNGRKAPVTYVLRSHQKKLKLLKVAKARVDKVYSTLDSIDHVFAVVDDPSKPPSLSKHLKPVFLQSSNESVSKYLFSRTDTDLEADHTIDDIAGITFFAEWKGARQVFNTEFESIPLSREVSFQVGEAETLRIKTAPFNAKNRDLLDEITFKKPYDRVVVLNIAVDSMLVPSVKHVHSEPVPATVFEFTTGNRVLVRSDAVDGLEYPAYVSFVDGVIVGEGAVSHQKHHPDDVVYDIHRMLSTDFDPDHPDPSWAFNTSRGGDGEVTVHMGQSCSTAIVCFGLIVSAVKKSVESAVGQGIAEIGIKLPPGSVVSEDAKTSIGATIAVKLLVFN